MAAPSLSIRTTQVIRYVTPLREGGSLPAIVECDDGFLYVLKFRGAGQGPKALVAELLGGELARKTGLKVPEIVLAELDPQYGKSEPDQEIQDLLKASEGLNLGLHFLSGASMFDPVAFQVDPLLASKIVWLDAFLMNVDRTARNTNMLVWKNELWLIDHGASLYFHHNWDSWPDQSVKPFVQIRDHVLLPFADKMNEADDFMRGQINPAMIDEIVSVIPGGWLAEDENKEVYSMFLRKRLENADIFFTEINHAREVYI
jgi:hypothetical protein